MIDLGPHAVFIIGAYAGTALVILMMIALYLGDARRQNARLVTLEALGAKRRATPNS
jgi:heme exporter protein D